MTIEENTQIVKDFLAALGGGADEALLALVAEDIEWIIPGEDCRWRARTAATRD